MGSCTGEISEALPSVKVHRLMCIKLMKLVDRISYIFPAIESARPRCKSGIEVLCSLNLAMEKAKLLIQHCSESSKLYLAITGEAITLRCERVQNALIQSLSQIQNLVHVQLAAQISAILNDIKDAKFMMESYEEQAGRVLLDLLRQGSDATEGSELEAFQIAASRLQITSSKAHLIEKRSVKKLLDKVRETDSRKERILNYLLYLLRKYGKSIGGEQTVNVNVQCQDPHPSVNSACMNVARNLPNDQELHVPYSVPDSQKVFASDPVPPNEFMCPISQRIMHDPVIIDSGQTYERMWIEKWFNEGHYTCPRTQQKLSHFSVTPNSALKDLISKWCLKHEISIQDPYSQNIPPEEVYSCRISSSSSVASFGSSLNDVPIRTNDSSVSFGYSDTSSVEPRTVTDGSSVFPHRDEDHCNCQSFLNFSQGRNSDVFTEVNGLPWVSQYKVMEDVKSHLQGNEQSNHSILCSNFFPILVRFLKDACERCDVKAQKVGVHLLLIFARKSREEAVSASQEVLHLLVSLLDSEMVEEALGIMQVFSDDQFSTSKSIASGALPSILEILDSKFKELQVPAIKVLSNLSSHGNTIAQLLQLGYITKLVSFLGDSLLAEHCIVILKNMCNVEKGRTAVAEAGCITSIAELLETGTHGEQENAVAILLSLCSHCFDYCHLVMKEGVVPSLVTISINGNDGGKEKAQQLLQLLRDITYTESQETPLPVPEPISEFVSESSNSAEKPSSIKARFFRRKIRFLSKPRSLALF